MNVRYIYVSVSMAPAQFAVLAKRAANKHGVYLAYANGVISVPLKCGRALACAYAKRIAEVNAELAPIL